MHIKSGLALGVAILASACLPEARIAAPVAAPGAAELLELRGMGGGTKGSFRIGQSQGSFTRAAGRTSAFGVIDKRGGGSFHLAGPLAEGGLVGRCTFGEGEVELGKGISVLAAPVRYSCQFDRAGRPVDGGLFIGAAHDSLGSLTRYERKGVLIYGAERIDIRSIHHFQGGKLPTSTPLGYSFEVNGTQIGAIDMNGSDKTIFAPRDPIRREAVLAASMALAVFWDPADTE